MDNLCGERYPEEDEMDCFELPCEDDDARDDSKCGDIIHEGDPYFEYLDDDVTALIFGMFDSPFILAAVSRKFRYVCACMSEHMVKHSQQWAGWYIAADGSVEAIQQIADSLRDYSYYPDDNRAAAGSLFRAFARSIVVRLEVLVGEGTVSWADADLICCDMLQGSKSLIRRDIFGDPSVDTLALSVGIPRIMGMMSIDALVVAAILGIGDPAELLDHITSERCHQLYDEHVLPMHIMAVALQKPPHAVIAKIAAGMVKPLIAGESKAAVTSLAYVTGIYYDASRQGDMTAGVVCCWARLRLQDDVKAEFGAGMLITGRNASPGDALTVDSMNGLRWERAVGMRNFTGEIPIRSAEPAGY